MSAAEPLSHSFLPGFSFLLLLAAAMAGCTTTTGDAEDLPWHGRDVTGAGWHNVTLEGGWSFEANIDARAGDTIAWDWAVHEEGPTFTWDLHFHDGQAVRTVQGGADAEGKGSFTAPEDQTYSFLWTNDDSRLHVLWFRITPDFEGMLFPDSSGSQGS